MVDIEGVENVKRGTIRFVPASGGQPVTVQIRNGALMSPVRLADGEWEATVADVTGVISRHQIHATGETVAPLGTSPKQYFITGSDRA